MDSHLVKTLTKEDNEILKKMYMFLDMNYLDNISCTFDETELKLMKNFKDKDEYTLLKKINDFSVTYVGIYEFNFPHEPKLVKKSLHKNYKEDKE